MKKIVVRIIVIAQVLVLLALGLLGLLVPVIPGILFLMIAAVIAARYFPFLESWLHKNRYSAECMRVSDRFFNLHAWDKLRLCFWGSLKFTLNGVEWTIQFLDKQYKKLLQT